MFTISSASNEYDFMHIRMRARTLYAIWLALIVCLNLCIHFTSFTDYFRDTLWYNEQCHHTCATAECVCAFISYEYICVHVCVCV